MSEQKLQADAVCGACGGTGLYVGIAERDGATVVCSRCDGCGMQPIEWEPFTGRAKPPPTVERVFRISAGIVIGGDSLREFGGVSVTQWLQKGADAFVRGTEDRKHTCPAWYYQSADDSRDPKWPECTEPGRRFFECPHFAKRGRCWARFDAEEEPEQ